MNTIGPTITLAGNVEMPIVGFGTYHVSQEDAPETVKAAILNGYRHIDTADGYQNETGVGKGIATAIAATGITRQDLFITTKFWPGNAAWGDVPKTYSGTLAAFEASLAALDLQYLDLYLIHAPSGGAERLNEWRALVDLQSQGKIRTIGVSNFTEAHIEEIKAAGLPLPSVNQIELHPWSQKPELVAYLLENGITPVAYSSLVPLSNWRANDGQDSAKTADMKADGADANSPFLKMAEKYGVSEAQLLLRWGIENGFAIIPKSMSTDRMLQNLDIFGFAIDDEDLERIRTMDRGAGVAWPHGDPRFLG